MFASFVGQLLVETQKICFPDDEGICMGQSGQGFVGN